MTFTEQLQLALDADLWVGVHGNGLSWIAMMEPGSAAIELWPNHPYNANYHHFARRANVFLGSVNGGASCPQRCTAAYDVSAAATAAKKHLERVQCEGAPFDLTEVYERERTEAAARKADRRRLRQRGLG